MVAFAVGAVLAMVCWPFYRHISPWVGGNLFLVGVTLAHLRYASRFIVPFPHIALLMAALQYVLAAWASAYWPADDPLYDIGSRLPQYLPFATLVLLACALGWGFGMNNLRLPARLPSVVATPRLLFALDALLVLGVLFVLPARFVSGTNYGFVFVLLASLRFVGVFGRMLLQWPGWGWRLALLALLELVFSTNQSSFHGIILFGFWTFA